LFSLADNVKIIERLARLGYVSKGIVYVVVGGLAAAAIAGRGRTGADKHDAFRFILDAPFGRMALLVMVIGLAGYAFWRISSSVTDSERRGTDAKGLALRAGSAIRGLFYGWIAFELVGMIVRHRDSGGGSDTQARHWSARIMEKPLGRWLVAIIGISIIAYGVYQLYVGIRGKLSKQIRTRAVPDWLVAVSRFGLGARGVVFAIVGGSLIAAAVQYDPSEARGMAGALRTLAAQPFGPVLLAITAVGLAAYGMYAFVNARYRDIAAA
jgi:hypothetical protein